MKDKESVTIAYSKPAKQVSIIGDFPSYNNKIKLNFDDKQFSINLCLPPGKYYYKYSVDNIETVEYDIPIEILNGERFNIFTVKDKYKDSSSQSLSKFKIEELIEIDQRIMTLEEESLLPRKPREHPDPFPETGNLIPNATESNSNVNANANTNNALMPSHHLRSQKTKSFLDFSNSYSMKIESTAHDYNNQMLQLQNDEKEEKVIVYNIADDFLIQMVIIKEGITDAHYAKFHYVDKNEDIIIHRNDVFFQPIDSFDIFGNFSDLKIINELALLKNMQMRLASNHNICFIKDILLLFNKEEGNKRKFFISEFIRNDNKLNEPMTIIYKNNFVFSNENSKDDKTVFDFFSNYAKLNYLALYQMFGSLFKKLFSLFKINLRYLYHFSFDFDSKGKEKGHHQGGIRFTFLPIFPSNCLTNALYEKNILFNNNSSSLSLFLSDSNDRIANNHFDKEISLELLRLELKQSLSTHQIKSYFQDLYGKFITGNTVVLNEIYGLITKINLKHHFIQCLKFVLVAYLATNYRSVFNSTLSSLLRIDRKLVENVKANNLMFYSNIVILALLNYINHLLSFQFGHKDKNNSAGNEASNLLLFFNSNIKEDDILVNEVIRQRISATQSEYSSNINSISQFIKLYSYDNLAQFEQSLSSYDVQIINIIENIYDLTSLKELYKAKFKKLKLLEIFKLSSANAINQFSQFEVNAKTIRQVWLIDPGVTYDDFFGSQEKIVEFLQMTQIVEYASFYRIHRGYFREYSFEQFFRCFLPILSDIDNKYNLKKVPLYQTLIKNFISDLQTFQGITEAFEVNDEGIRIDYKTFETMMLLLKNLNDEKAVMIQKVFKGRAVYSLIALLKKHAVIIQRNYRSKIYNKIKLLSQKELASFLINKYLHSDPIIIKLILNSQKRLNELIEENNSLRLSIEEMNRLKTDANSGNSSRPLIRNMASVKSSKNFALNQQQKDEIAKLKDKLKESRTKFKNLVVTIAEYEKKMENFVKMINSNGEMRDVLYKNGIKIN